MKLFELFADNVFRISIMEMAYERRKCVDIITGISPEISNNLIKILAFDDQAKTHWLKEINAHLYKVDDLFLKPNNKKLSGDMYYKLLWDEPLNNGVSYITNKIDRYINTTYSKCKRSTLSEYEIYEQCERILHDISYDIAHGKFTSIEKYI